MKKAIKRGQNQACLSYAERELFGATLKKKAYNELTLRVVALHHKTQLLASSDEGQGGGAPSSTPPNEIHDYDDWFG